MLLVIDTKKQVIGKENLNEQQRCWSFGNIFLIIIGDNYTLLIPLNGHFIQCQREKMKKKTLRKTALFGLHTYRCIHTLKALKEARLILQLMTEENNLPNMIDQAV